MEKVNVQMTKNSQMNSAYKKYPLARSRCKKYNYLYFLSDSIPQRFFEMTAKPK